MEYCTFSFQVSFEDGNGVHGIAPYRGDSLSEMALRSFVKSYFSAGKPKEIVEIQVQIDKVYIDPIEWVTDIKNWETFKYLQSVNNYGGDLIAKYFPNEIE